MYICIYIHIYTHTHTYTHIYVFYCIFIYTIEYYSVIGKEKKILTFVTTCMGLRASAIIEISDKKRQILHDFTYMWNLKKP